MVPLEVIIIVKSTNPFPAKFFRSFIKDESSSIGTIPSTHNLPLGALS